MAAVKPHEAAPSQAGLSRRSRPPNLELLASDQNRVPLRADKLGRRESKLGLKSIFNRSKSSKDTPPKEGLSNDSESSSIRESIVDLTGIPYDQLSTLSSSPRHITRPLSIGFESPSHAPKSPLYDNSSRKQKSSSAKKPRPVRHDVANVDCPPLFKAYPQAHRRATLPAFTTSADTILRFHERSVNSSSRRTRSSLEDGAKEGEGAADGDASKSKRRHRRSTSSSSLNLDWTTKVFILTTSGYLLQYAGEGPFNRLPEKSLRLGRTSAAFASDIIPGRHWVMQVSSTTDPDGSSTTETKSLLSKIAFRNTEKRSASNLLMVFECAEDLEIWIATLRHEIEQLGGKKSLSETGKPRAANEILRLRERPSQRTLVVKDPNRFSRATREEMNWEDAFDVQQARDCAVMVTDMEAQHDHSLDEMSVTNSVVSQDGRQLDALRESANRLSYVSSGQRTVVTSAGSSPACSPSVESFPSAGDESISRNETRLRPNASAIIDRRRSMQTMSPFVDSTSEANATYGARPQSYNLTAMAEDREFSNWEASQSSKLDLAQTIPRRPSYMRSPSFERETLDAVLDDLDAIPRVSARRPPPTALRLSRPLSMVLDQPSPKETVPERPATRHENLGRPPSMDRSTTPVPPASSRQGQNTMDDFPYRRSSLLHKSPSQRLSTRTSPRRLSSMGTLRTHVEFPTGRRPADSPPPRPPRPPMYGDSLFPRFENIDRARSALSFHEGDRANSPAPKRVPKRSSMFTDVPSHSVRASFLGELQGQYGRAPPPPLRGPPPNAPLPPIPPVSRNSYLRVDMGSRPLHIRRSMPHLTEGPPPAPPPKCPLPPIPQREPNFI